MIARSLLRKSLTAATLLVLFTLPDDGYCASIEDVFPSLKTSIPRIRILPGPTPVHALPGLARELGVADPNALLIKRDDQSASLLGGNKARKLEYLMGEARARGGKSLITSGMWGSNHALATAIAAHELGFRAHLHLGPQPITENVKLKLLASHTLGANLHYHSSTLGLGFGILKGMIADALGGGTVVHIPPGGSNPTGSLGYINGYLELAEQLRHSPQGMPERIVVPVGSMGTAAGLLVGMCVAGDFEKIRIVGVGVTEPLLSNESKTRAAARELHQFLKSKLTPQERLRLPDCDYENSKKSFEFSGDFYQPGYGAPSDSTLEAIAMLVRTDSIHLDGTYSGKAMAWLLSDLRSRPQGAPAPRTVYWLTYNSHDLKPLIQDHPWSNPEKPWLDLPSDFHWIFEAANR